MNKRIVHVTGTGTIGEPLIGFLLDFRKELGIDEVTFHKKTPLTYDRSKVKDLISRGASLAVDGDKYNNFLSLGLVPRFTLEDAIHRASVVVDCTPKGVGHDNKRKYYSRYKEGGKGFIAQGSESGFGKPYARGINDSVLVHGEDQFIQVVSCNTHNLAILLKTLPNSDRDLDNQIEMAYFVCIRRGSDISQHKRNSIFIPSPEVGKHTDPLYGTHHARDAHDLFATMGYDLKLHSSAMKVNTQYMHTLWFSIRMRNYIYLNDILQRLESNPRIALTEKPTAGEVFSFGRDHGHYGRILNPTVVVRDTLHLVNEQEVAGFCFTPQDGNSLLSSISAVTWFLHPEDYKKRTECLKPYLFQEV